MNDLAEMAYFLWLDRQPIRDSDGSGEADETQSGSAVGDSAGRETASPTPSSEPHHDQP